MNSPLLEISGLSYAYPEGAVAQPPRWTLHDVNLSLDAGSCLGVMGPAGAGKSTLAQAILGIVPQSSGGVIQGNVTVSGVDTQTTPVPDMASRVGLVLEDPDVQFLTNSVEEELAFGIAQQGLDPVEIHARLRAGLEAFDLARYAERAPHQLSGGERQRVALAAILAMQPQLLVLDEPASRLDATSSDELQTRLNQLRRQGMTLVVISNDIEWLWPLADQLLILEAGRVQTVGPTVEVLADRQALTKAGLRPPQLLDLADRLGASLPKHARRSPSATFKALEDWMGHSRQ